MTDALQDLPAPALGRPPIAVRGEDIRRWIPHYRDGRVRRVELDLVNGDVIVLDPFTLRLLAEVARRLGLLALVPAPRGARP